MNMQLAYRLLQKCVDAGVENFVVCAGARNAPLVKILAASPEVTTNYFYDERAAAFFALGRAKRDGRPVVVVTTSGTAVAETYPAVIEAYYSGYPIVILSADRPADFRNTGAPQTIDQLGIFAQYAGSTIDIKTLQDVPANLQFLNTPTHINLCLSEPLLDGPVESLKRSAISMPFIKNTFSQVAVEKREALRVHLAEYNKPLYLIGTLLPEEKSFVTDVLLQTQGLVFAESTSGLTNDSDSAELKFVDDRGLRALTPAVDFDIVVRVGGVPTTRFWRDLEGNLSHVPAVSFSRLEFTGLARANMGVWPLSCFSECAIFNLSSKYAAAKATGVNTSSVSAKCAMSAKIPLEELLDKFPQSEPALLANVLGALQVGQDVFVGNSLPIRELDLLTPSLKNDVQVWANRGVNGIDGLINTALGLARADRPMAVVLGDLSALYDLNAISQRRCSDARQLQVVVINNAGGKIFRRMFHDSNFENRHEWRFDKWAEMFGFEYLPVARPQDLPAGGWSDSSCVIELLPDDVQTEKFWNEYEGQGK